MGTIEREPLPAGAVIEYCGEHGEVIHDPGGEGRVTVKVGDHQAQWWWTFEGVTCTVVSLPTDDQAQRKREVQALILLVREWFSQPGNEGGGIFHVMLEDGNVEQEFADIALEQARDSGNAAAIELAEKLAALTVAERIKVCNAW
ncbi:hypothetical protein [Pseudomonas aeruginosa]|uniref:hypothetical protein n=1 Tax=Pseudomonas aeruginosa TaxID=287 RepID=UPI000EB5FED3|nr:hypothetical protein [Pseudomonas aeruginosa]